MPTGTHIAYLHLCHRKLWLFANSINMEHSSELVAEGKLIDTYSYLHRAKRWQELEIESIKIDHYDASKGIVKEVKKSRRREGTHIAQLKYYLFVLERNGIKVSHGLLEYPKLRLSEEVWLDEQDRIDIPKWEKQTKDIIKQTSCPPLQYKSLCRRCAYYDFCFVTD
ncbi:MAG: CRISPR-associated protein Cas4 [Bacteroidota bacterium]